MPRIMSRTQDTKRIIQEFFGRECDPVTIVYANAKPKEDRETVLAAVKQNGLALQFVTDATLKEDRQIVLEAVKQNGLALRYAADSLKKDPDFILKAVKQNGLALRYVTGSLKGDRETVLAAVKQNGLALRYAADSLKGDRQIVLAAVQQSDEALRYVIQRNIDYDAVENFVENLIKLLSRHELQNNFIKKLLDFIDNERHQNKLDFYKFIINQTTPKPSEPYEITFADNDTLPNHFLIELAFISCQYSELENLKDKLKILPIPKKSCFDFFSCLNPFTSTCLSNPITHDSQQIGDTVLYNMLEENMKYGQHNSSDLCNFIKNNASSLVTYLKENQNIDPDIYKELMIIARFHSNQLNQEFVDEVFNNLDKKNIAIANYLLKFLQHHNVLTELNNQQTKDFYELKKSLLNKMERANTEAKKNKTKLPFQQVKLSFDGYPSIFNNLGEDNLFLFNHGSDIIKKKAAEIADILKNFPEETKIKVASHSFGGKVATAILEQCQESLPNVSFVFSSPFQSEKSFQFHPPGNYGCLKPLTNWSSEYFCQDKTSLIKKIVEKGDFAIIIDPCGNHNNPIKKKAYTSKKHYSSTCNIGLQDETSPIENQLQELLEALKNKTFFLILEDGQYKLNKKYLEEILKRNRKGNRKYCLCITDQHNEICTTTEMSQNSIDELWPQQQPTTNLIDELWPQSVQQPTTEMSPNLIDQLCPQSVQQPTTSPQTRDNNECLLREDAFEIDELWPQSVQQPTTSPQTRDNNECLLRENLLGLIDYII